MKHQLQAFMLIASVVSLTACYGPTQPPPLGGRSLDVPPRYGVPPQQTQFFEGVNMEDPNAAAVQPPNPNAPVTVENVTTPLANGTTTAPPPVTFVPPGNTSPPTTASSTPATPPAAPSAPAEIPFATRIPGKAGFVKSPFDLNGQAIDVRDFQSGQKARCPYTGKVFRVP
jgi:hypothetical protein